MEYALDKLDGSELGGRRWVWSPSNNQIMRTLAQDQAVRGGQRWGTISVSVEVEVAQPKEAQGLEIQV